MALHETLESLQESFTATGPRLTTTNLVVQGIGIFHPVIYLVLESVGCPRLACDTRYDFEYEYRKSGRRFCQTHVYTRPHRGKLVSKRTFPSRDKVCDSVSRTRVRALLHILSTFPRSRTSPALPSVVWRHLQPATADGPCTSGP